MKTPFLPPRPRFRTMAGTVTTILLLTGIAAAGTVVVIAAVAVVGSIAGGLFIWSRASARTRVRHSLYS